MKKILVIKLGTSSLFNESTMDTKLSNMAQLVEMAVNLRKNMGYQVCFVSSGGIAAGLQQMGLKTRPKTVSGVQAMAAIGQCRLMGLWERLFSQLNQPVAQVLLTRTDIADRMQYCNARAALQEMLDMGVIPIVNENDTLTSREARFGDNDTLSAMVAAMIGATHLFLLTDVACLYSANPRLDDSAHAIRYVADANAIMREVSTAGGGSSVGTGGMTTKIIAATLATAAGCDMYITSSETLQTVAGALEDDEQNISPDNSQYLYTKFAANKNQLRDREIWLLHSLTSAGKIEVDNGAYNALTRRNRAGLLPAGVTKVEGHFHAEECVDIVHDGKIVGRCLVNYSSIELERIKGYHSNDILGLLGYADSEYVAFRDNLAFYRHT
ncbi:glutamate 5-kinase [Starmerella bacillaris]|uniref:Glutamate 5-kinase n=1 Tax=Starmerella bacillaris TaxID=1247836 RepID=A0AAV5RQP5_STABA|nr:glutamate 5-kinase [Starmerella bacillaris]